MQLLGEAPVDGDQAVLPQLLVPAGFRAMPSAPRTFPAFAPLRPLDALFVRGDVQIRRAARGEIAIARRASDHLPLVVDLELATA